VFCYFGNQFTVPVMSVGLFLFTYAYERIFQTRKPSWRWQTRATQKDEKIPPFRSCNKFQSSRKSGVYSN